MFFGRALSPLELQYLHRRGRTLAGFELRVCDAPASEAEAEAVWAEAPWANLDRSGGRVPNANDGRLGGLPFLLDAAEEFSGRSPQLRVVMRSDMAEVRPVIRDPTLETR